MTTPRRLSRRAVIGGGVALGGAALAAAVARSALLDARPRSTDDAAPAAPAPTSVASRGEAFPEDRRVRVQHLLRRAGFAPTHDEVERALALADSELVDEVVHPERVTEVLPPALERLPGADARPADLVSWWLARMTASARPALEKTTFFWHGLHTSGFDKLGNRGVSAMAGQNAFQREFAYARFADILRGVSKQPAMMTYLDTVDSTKAHPNENFARELMELFSMGEGHYTEQDVREAARAFTGYAFDRTSLEFRLRPQQADTGVKTVLGVTGPLDGDGVVGAITRHPATPLFVARRVWTYFAEPNPEPAVVEDIARVFRATDGDMREVLRAVFSHPAFYGPGAYRALVKSPVEYTVGALRQLGIQTDGSALLGPLRAMGQLPFNPPNVAGWRGGAAWVGSSALLAGINALDAMIFRAEGGMAVESYLERRRIITAGELVTDLAALLVDGRLAPAAHATLVDYVSNGEGAAMRLGVLPPAARVARVRGAIYLTVAGPEYHLA